MKTLNFLNRLSFEKAISALDRVGVPLVDIGYSDMLINVEDDNLCEVQETLEIAGIVDDAPRLTKLKDAAGYWIDYNY